jgi:hypothetical protein
MSAPNPEPTPAPKIAVLNGQQRRVHRALTENEPARTLAAMYLGALQVLGDPTNGDRLPLAAHGLRELAGKFLERIAVFGTDSAPGRSRKGRTNLTQAVRQHQEAFARIKTPTNANKPKNWVGLSISTEIGGYLSKSVAFFEAFEEQHPKRQRFTVEALRRVDPTPSRLPEKIEELRAEEWMECLDFFTKVCHHDVVTDAQEVDSWLNVLERFVLDRLVPRTFDDQAEIKKLIEEAERGS